MSTLSLTMLVIGIVAGWQANNQVNGTPVPKKT